MTSSIVQTHDNLKAMESQLALLSYRAEESRLLLARKRNQYLGIMLFCMISLMAVVALEVQSFVTMDSIDLEFENDLRA